MYNNDMYDNDMYRQYRPNAMARASFNLGILSLMFCSIFYIALPCGALAILCAVLSRTGSSLPRRCRFGIISGLCGMIATLVITGTLVKKVFTDPEIRSYLEYYLQAYTGDYELDLDEELSNIFPFLKSTSEKEQDENGTAAEDLEEKNTPAKDREENPAQNMPAIPQNGEGIFL